MLTGRQLNRATLARQLLLERATGPVPAAIERLVGLQAQQPSPPFVGLWTRVAGFDRADLAHDVVGTPRWRRVEPHQAGYAEGLPLARPHTRSPPAPPAATRRRRERPSSAGPAGVAIAVLPGSGIATMIAVGVVLQGLAAPIMAVAAERDLRRQLHHDAPDGWAPSLLPG